MPSTYRGCLSQRALSLLTPGQWCSESLGYGRGALQVRATKAGLRFYYRTGGSRARIPLGAAQGPHAISLHQAREQCWKLAANRLDGKEGSFSLGALLKAYATYLEQRGSTSASKVWAMLRRHVQSAEPAIWMRPARDIRPEDCVCLLEPLVTEGKHPTAIKLRTALHAAFELAVGAPLCAESGDFRSFGVLNNPVKRVRPITGVRPLPERVLSVREFQALWGYLKMKQGPAGSVLRFYLLTGAQRLEQLVRARREDLDEDGLTLWDRKGRRVRPRRHLVPLIGPARLAMMAMGGAGSYLVSIDGGRSSLHPSTLWRYVNGVASTLLAQGEVSFRFSPTDLRRTVETRLAALKVAPIVRAQLQSHGLSGVQSRHYDRHAYLDEKREALEQLYRLMNS